MLIITGLLALLSILLNIVQFINSKENLGIIDSLTTTNAAQNEKIEKMETKISDLSDDSKNYKKIVRAVKNGNVGYANRNFCASDGIVVLKENSTQSITLTTGITASYDVTLDSIFIASVSFDEEEWWNSSTTLTIKANKEGVAVATFSNSKNDETFSVIIIVTD